MNLLGKIIGDKIGVGVVFNLGYQSVRPQLKRWAESDGEDDWDDTLVDILDALVGAIAHKVDNG